MGGADLAAGGERSGTGKRGNSCSVSSCRVYDQRKIRLRLLGRSYTRHGSRNDSRNCGAVTNIIEKPATRPTQYGKLKFDSGKFHDDRNVYWWLPRGALLAMWPSLLGSCYNCEHWGQDEMGMVDLMTDCCNFFIHDTSFLTDLSQSLI